MGIDEENAIIIEDLDDDVFTTPEDTEILERDIPERLQIKLKNRLNPLDEEIVEESEWIFHIIIESL